MIIDNNAELPIQGHVRLVGKNYYVSKNYYLACTKPIVALIE